MKAERIKRPEVERQISFTEAMEEAARHDCGLMQAHYRIRSREYLKRRIRARS